MSDARLELGIGALKFSAEGTETWISEQFREVLGRLDQFASLQIVPIQQTSVAYPEEKQHTTDIHHEYGSATLPAFLQRCGATSNANKKFLATALWTMSKQGKSTFTVKDVTAALSVAQQSKLANPSQSLARVVKAGQAESSSGGEYYITPEGRRELGLQEQIA